MKIKPMEIKKKKTLGKTFNRKNFSLLMVHQKWTAFAMTVNPGLEVTNKRVSGSRIRQLRRFHERYTSIHLWDPSAVSCAWLLIPSGAKAGAKREVFNRQRAHVVATRYTNMRETFASEARNVRGTGRSLRWGEASLEKSRPPTRSNPFSQPF